MSSINQTNPRAEGEPMDISEDAFACLVDEALAELPPQMLANMDNIAVFIADEPADGAPILGLYEGIDLTEREDYGGLDLPDQITLFRLPLLRASRDEAELKREIYITVVHEFAHHFGIDDEQLHQLGWA